MSDKPVCELMDCANGLDVRLVFHCPGCGEGHAPRVRSTDAGYPCWEWNGNLTRPTLAPSIKVTGYRMSAEGRAMVDRGEKPPDGDRYPGHDTVCHSFVRDGQIQFLGDCTHALAGQTVPLEPIA